jgi:hypothetical protein
MCSAVSAEPSTAGCPAGVSRATRRALPRPGRRPLPIAAGIVAAVVLGSAPAHADTLRCDTGLITTGDTAGELLARCGRPAQVDQSQLLRPPVIWLDGRPWRLPGGDLVVPVELWTYNLGPNKLMRRVRLEDGRVKAIETLGYGYLD